MMPQIYPSKFSDCSNPRQVFEKIMNQKFDEENHFKKIKTVEKVDKNSKTFEIKKKSK